MCAKHGVYCAFCFFSPRTTSQHFSLDSGRRSSIHTKSPTEYALVSSCAWYFFEVRTVFFIVAWVKRRSTRTTTVLACLSLTTTPWSVRFGIYDPLLLRLIRFVGLSPRLGARRRCRGSLSSGSFGLGGFRLLRRLRHSVGFARRLRRAGSAG